MAMDIADGTSPTTCRSNQEHAMPATKHLWTPEAEARLCTYLATSYIPGGLGTRHAACSIAAINLALDGHLSADIPDCMSVVIGRWLIRIQDAMPDTMRNSSEWRELLPLAAGTGRDHEPARLAVLIDWLWDAVMPRLQLAADDAHFGETWAAMCAQRTADAGHAASAAARSPSISGYTTPVYAGAAAGSAATAVLFSDDLSVPDDTGDVGEAASCVARAAVYVAAAKIAPDADTWRTFDPVGLLRRMIEISGLDDQPALGRRDHSTCSS